MADSRDSRPSKSTIRDVAASAGVSIATVSRVINGRPDVAPETRELVMEAVRERNFRTNRSAQALSMGRTRLIGFTIPILHAEYFALIMSGTSEALYERDMRLVVCPTLHERAREITLLDRLMEGATDGAIILLPSESSAELCTLHERSYPFVVIDPREPLDEGIPSVSAANTSGARSATRHLMHLGHKRIAIITGIPTWAASRERLSGYSAALATRGILPHPDYIRDANFNVDGGYRAAQELLDLPEPPTATFAVNDNMAIGAIQAAHDRGLEVPRDLSIVGFDDAVVARIVTPALTTVRQPLQEMGRVAVSILCRLIEGQRIEALRVELATKLVVRDSTAPPPPGS